MKKHSGAVLYAALTVLIFGLILMAGAEIVKNAVFGTSYGQAPEIVKEVVNGTGEMSFTLTAIGAVMLGLGLFMRSTSE